MTRGARNTIAWALALSLHLGCGGDDRTAGDGGARADGAPHDGATVRADGSEATDGAVPGDGGSRDGGIGACPDPDPGAMTYEEYAEASRLALCGLHARCGEGLFPRYQIGLGCRGSDAPDPTAPLVAAGTVCFDATRAAGCIEALASTDCHELVRTRLAACDGVLRPMLEPGEGCVADAECFGGECVSGAECPGRCEALPGTGEPCATSRDCASGLYCADRTCQPRQGEGGPCQTWLGCQSGLACVGGRCSTPLAEGEECAPYECAEELFCYSSGSSGVCRARAAEGEACDPAIWPGATAALCDVGLVCVNGAMCASASGPGEACAYDDQCPAGFTCHGSVCVVLPGAGEACETDVGCWEGDCRSGVCEQRGAGSPCDSDRDCEGYCDMDAVFGNECAAPRAEGDACSNVRHCEDGLTCRAEACRAPCAR